MAPQLFPTVENVKDVDVVAEPGGLKFSPEVTPEVGSKKLFLRLFNKTEKKLIRVKFLDKISDDDLYYFVPTRLLDPVDSRFRKCAFFEITRRPHTPIKHQQVHVRFYWYDADGEEHAASPTGNGPTMGIDNP